MSFLIISIIVLLIVSLLYLISFYLIPKKGYVEKLSSYESGFEPFSNARMKFDILYWIIGLLYLIFDLEIIFLFPFGAIILSQHSLFAYLALLIFFIILTLAFVYEYKKGAQTI